MAGPSDDTRHDISGVGQDHRGVGIKRVLMPTAFSGVSTHTLAYARQFALRCRAHLTILCVVDPAVAPPGPFVEAEMHAREASSERFLRSHPAFFHQAAPGSQDSGFEVRFVVGEPGARIVQFARVSAVDLIVVSAHDHGLLTHVLLGSTTERVVRHAPCPVLVVR